MAFYQYVDISQFQPTTVSYFKSLKRHGAKGAFIRMNYGYGFPDSTAATKIRLAEKYLNFIGCYAFFRQDPIKEAHYFLALIKKDGMDKSTPVMLDVENDPYNGPYSGHNGPQTHLINEWTKVIYNAGYHNIFIYSSTSWLKDGYHIKPELLHHGHIWAAAYGATEPGVNNASAWQYTDNWHGLNTDGDYLFLSLSDMTGKKAKPKHHAKKSVIKKRVPKENDLTKGTYFEAISNLDGFSASNFKEKNGDFLPKGARFHGMIVSDGQVKRIKTGLGYYSANKKLVKAI